MYLFDKTTGDAQTHLAARYHDKDDGFTAAQEMIDHLVTIYIDPHKTWNARTDFKKLVMRPSGTFHDFYTKFLRLAGDCKIPLEDYQTELYDKLTLDLQKAILPTYGPLKIYRQLADQRLLLDREFEED